MSRRSREAFSTLVASILEGVSLYLERKAQMRAFAPVGGFVPRPSWMSGSYLGLSGITVVPPVFTGQTQQPLRILEDLERA